MDKNKINKENRNPKIKIRSILKNPNATNYYKKKNNDQNERKKKYVSFFLYPEVIYIEKTHRYKKKNFKSCCNSNSCIIF